MYVNVYTFGKSSNKPTSSRALTECTRLVTATVIAASLPLLARVREQERREERGGEEERGYRGRREEETERRAKLLVPIVVSSFKVLISNGQLS